MRPAFHLAAAGALLFFAGSAAAERPLPPPPDEPHLEFSADHFDYESSSAVIHFKGHVRIAEKYPEGVRVSTALWTLRADEIWLGTEDRNARTAGSLDLEGGRIKVKGERGEFDFDSRSGFLENPITEHGDWNLKARRLDVSPNGTLDYRGAYFTGCGFDHAHYYFRSSRVHVVPKKYLLATNTVFYIGKIPIFYTPFLYKSLKKRKWLKARLQPGYDRRNGIFLKSTLATSHTPFLYSKLYLDYYTAQGMGLGGELHGRKEDARGALFAYRIKETFGSDEERWAYLGQSYMPLTGALALQGRLQVQSDPQFNNAYNRSNSFRVTPELVNDMAFVYRMPKLTTRLSVSRRDQVLGSGRRFIKTKESLPRLDLQSAPLKFWKLPWLNTLTGFADNSYELERDFQQRSVGAEWEGTRSFVLARGVSFSPKLAYGQRYLSREDALTSFASTATKRDVFVGRYRTEGTLRFDTPVGDWDLSHIFQRRQKPDTFQDDAGALDHGIEQNLLFLQDTLRPTRRTLLRIHTGYNFRKFRDRSWGFRRRVEPIVGEVLYTPRHDVTLSVRDDYQLDDGNRSFIFDGEWGDREKDYIAGGVAYNRSTPRTTYLNLNFGIASSTTGWRIGAGLRSAVSSNGGAGRMNNFRLFEKEFLIARTFHDFFARALVRFRPGGVREFFIRIDMTLPSLIKDPVIHRDWEAEWFPEREKGLEDRP